jgi:hypothetical protein
MRPISGCREGWGVMSITEAKKVKRTRLLIRLSSMLLLPVIALGQSEPTPVVTQHPALFLVGDSIMHTGTGTGET